MRAGRYRAHPVDGDPIDVACTLRDVAWLEEHTDVLRAAARGRQGMRHVSQLVHHAANRSGAFSGDYDSWLDTMAEIVPLDRGDPTPREAPDGPA